MKTVFLLGVCSVVFLSACASQPALPEGMSEGVFTRLQCEGGKGFSARFAEAGQSVRVRALHGSAELVRQSPGVFEGDDYRLMTEGADGIALFHKGKPEARLCKPAA